ncbi:hypothetical protein LOTGIDRAFT_162799 [Lottia gigantea]|uniref:CUB domain-containing protein n=1 Tax=Lottia gigantea TaxID=225164 RepID=V3ZLA4_LOTGI|nr:hypothetical protein LOTGIDRAFT_162799 [Lottia gigantea]ESO92148.1 hypothetical protein LOTGIDRAFT_162799 [Lottia gigantea]
MKKMSTIFVVVFMNYLYQLSEQTCISQSCLTHSLSCSSGQVLSVRAAYYYKKSSGPCADACADPTNCCNYKSGDFSVGSLEPATLEYIRHECTAQQTCTFTVPYNSNSHYIFYNTVCVSESKVLSLLCKDSVSTLFQSYMFYHGRHRSDSKAVTCSCEIDAPSGELSVRSEYVNLHATTCPSFSTSLSKVNLNACGTNGLQKQYGYLGKVSVPLTLDVKNLISRSSDVFWLLFQGAGSEQITVTCQGCGVKVTGACGRTQHVFVGCYGASSCNSHTLTCKPGKFIGLTSRLYRGRKANAASCTLSSCNTVADCCEYVSNDPRELLNQKETERIHASCDGKETCDFNPDLSNPAFYTFSYYVYDCIPSTSFVDVVTGGSLSGETELFLTYKGASRTAGTSTSCSCDITSASFPIDVSVYRLSLHPDSCCQFKMSSSLGALPSACAEPDGAKLYTYSFTSSSALKIQLDNMIARTGDSLFVRIGSASGIDASCGGCFEQPVVEDATTVCQYPKNETTTEETATGASTGDNGGDEDGNIIAIAAGTVGGIVLLGLLIFAVRRFMRSKKTDPLNF